MHILQLVLSRRRCIIWMIVRSSDSTISFSVVVKVPVYHPNDPGSTPARVIFYLFFYLGFTARQDYFTRFEPNQS